MANKTSTRATERPPATAQRQVDWQFITALARAFGGAIIFSLPMLMTMEMWSLGFYMDRLRLALLLLVLIPLLAGLSHYIGYEETFRWKDDVVDAFVAFAVGFVASTVVLWLLAVIGPVMPAHEIIGKISLQAVPGSVGAMLAGSQLGTTAEQKERGARYLGEIFIMAVGALFLALNVAPTEEMVLIAFKMTPGHAVALVVASLLMMHAFVFAVEFRGQASVPPGTPFWSVFLRFTVVGYAVALLISTYALWTFERTGGLTLTQVLTTVTVLGFPAAIGAAAARLVL